MKLQELIHQLEQVRQLVESKGYEPTAIEVLMKGTYEPVKHVDLRGASGSLGGIAVVLK